MPNINRQEDDESLKSEHHNKPSTSYRDFCTRWALFRLMSDRRDWDWGTVFYRESKEIFPACSCNGASHTKVSHYLCSFS